MSSAGVLEVRSVYRVEFEGLIRMYKKQNNGNKD